MKYTGFTRPTTIEQVNKYFEQKGFKDWVLIKGDLDLFYAQKKDGKTLAIQSTLVNRVTERTLGKWLDDLKYIIEREVK